MGDFLSKLFVDVEEIPHTWNGMVQLLFLFFVYSFILYQGASMISNGSELLLLVPKWSGLIGSIVLPFLGAVPDAAIVLFSGLGDAETVKKQISIGVGALAGSTILLITIPWTMSIFAGRVSLNENGEGNYIKPLDAKAGEFQKLLTKDRSSFSHSGINVDPIVKSNVKFIVFSLLTYLFIQATNLIPTKTGDKHTNWVTVVAVCCLYAMCILVWYFSQQYRHSKENIVSEAVKEERLKKSIQNGLVNISGVLCSEIEALTPSGNTTTPLLSPSIMEHVRILVRGYWLRYDVNKDGVLSVSELRQLLRDLGESMNEEEVKEIMHQFDKDGNNTLSFEEFVSFILILVEHRRSGHLTHIKTDHVADDGDEEEAIPDDLCHLTPAKQQSRIIQRSFTMMIAGTALVILFSDPIVELLDNFGERIHVNSFYVSFVLAPLISNLSEVIASFKYAAKKTQKSSTISVCTLQGSAIMNNTVCLGVFLFIIASQGLHWTFTAETIAVLVVEVCVVCVSFMKKQTLWTASFLLLLYPLSLVIVAVLESLGFN